MWFCCKIVIIQIRTKKCSNCLIKKVTESLNLPLNSKLIPIHLSKWKQWIYMSKVIVLSNEYEQKAKMLHTDRKWYNFQQNERYSLIGSSVILYIKKQEAFYQC